MAGTRRSPSQYNFRNLKFDEMLLPTSGNLRRSSPRSGKIKHVTIHHMTVKDSNNGEANRKCVEIWRSRQASAHYGVDRNHVAQFVYDKRMAWGNGNGTANQEGLVVEHANSTIGDKNGWQIAEATLKTSAKLVAALHLRHKLGRPTTVGFGEGGTVRTHRSWKATACPGPYFQKVWDRYMDMVQAEYDALTKKPAKKPPFKRPEYHTVVYGHRLSSIAKKYKRHRWQLIRWNKLKFPYRIKAGQRIYLNPPKK